MAPRVGAHKWVLTRCLGSGVLDERRLVVPYGPGPGFLSRFRSSCVPMEGGAVIRSAVPRQPRYSNPAVTAAAALTVATTPTRPSLPKATSDKGQIQPTPPKQSVSRQQVWSLSTSQPANVLPTSTLFLQSKFA